jgi:hypothetical protein|tara:strand:+ start:813 stop:935 length:123 start_codon:yes stop_codon:yes gene_type:complete
MPVSVYAVRAFLFVGIGLVEKIGQRLDVQFCACDRHVPSW